MVDLELRSASLTNHRAGFVMHEIHNMAGPEHTLMVASGNTVMLWPPAPSFSLHINSSSQLIISVMTTSSLFYVWPLVYFAPPPKWEWIVCEHWRCLSVPVTHSLCKYWFLWCIFNTFTSHFSIWITTTFMDGWLSGSAEQKNFLCAAIHSKIDSTHSLQHAGRVITQFPVKLICNSSEMLSFWSQHHYNRIRALVNLE